MMKFFYDCEFFEDGRTINLISIGIVREDDHEYYAVVSDAPWERITCQPWLMRNVVPLLPGSRISTPIGVPEAKPESAKREQQWFWHLDFTSSCVKPKWVIANEVREFLWSPTGELELWADCGDYDHVALMQLWGAMVHKPDGLPYYTRDLRQEIDRPGGSALPLPEQTTGLHNALDDARHNMVIARHLGLIA